MNQILKYFKETLFSQNELKPIPKQPVPISYSNLTLEQYILIAGKCRSLFQFRKVVGRDVFVQYVVKQGWGQEILKNLKVLDYAEAYAIAETCRNKSEFYKKDKDAYDLCRKNGWLKDVCAHMPKFVRRPVVVRAELSLEEVKSIALTCSNTAEFYKKDKDAYDWCRKKGILDQVCSHMPRRKRKSRV